MLRPQLPTNDPITEPKTGEMKWSFTEYLLGVERRLAVASERKKSVSLIERVASLPTTPVPVDAIAEGTYRVSYYARITTPGTVSSSLTIRIGWTDGEQACSKAGAPMVGNTETETQNGTFFLRVDQGSALTYETTYASVGATPMQYRLTVTVELVEVEA